jgi:tripeptide aminopeptidase
LKAYPWFHAEFKVQEQYRNMKEVLDQHPQVITNALNCDGKSGTQPNQRKASAAVPTVPRLSFMGLPCPNIFAGEHAFHSKLEWVSVQDMEKAVEVIVNLAQVWEEIILNE